MNNESNNELDFLVQGPVLNDGQPTTPATEAPVQAPSPSTEAPVVEQVTVPQVQEAATQPVVEQVTQTETQPVTNPPQQETTPATVPQQVQETAPVTTPQVQEAATQPVTGAETQQQIRNNVPEGGDLRSKEAILEEEMLNVFVGPNVDKILHKKMNFSAAFFGYLYFFYRKHFLFGIVSILIYYFIPYLMYDMELGFIPMSIAVLIVSFFLGLIFNEVYATKGRNTISTTIKQFDLDEAKQIIKSKGGTNSGFAVLGAVLFIVPQFFGVKMLFNYSNYNGALPADGVTYLDNVDLDKSIEIKIPEKFVKQEGHKNTNYSYINEYGSQCETSFKDCEYCTIEVETVTKDRSAKSFARRDAKYYGVDYEKKEINKADWYVYSHEYEDVGAQYDYVTEKDGKIYHLIFNDISTNKYCTQYTETTVESFKIKD